MKVFTLVVASAALVSGAMAGSLKSEIVATNAKLGKLMMAKNVDGFVKVIKGQVTKDFKYTEDGRTMTFDEMVAQMKMGFGMMQKITKAEAKLVSLNEKGSTAIGKTRHTMVATMVGPDKKPATMMMIGVSTDCYKRVNGKWLMYKMDWKNEKMTLNGKPFDPAQMGGKGGVK